MALDIEFNVMYSVIMIFELETEFTQATSGIVEIETELYDENVDANQITGVTLLGLWLKL